MKTKQIFDTVYSIREDGVVITGKGGILKPKLTKNGYHELALYDSGTKKYTWYRLNRLVAMVFIPNPENKPFVNHIDGNKTNNHVENLEWVTHQENMDHAKRTNLIKRGEESPTSIYTDEQIVKVCEMLQEGYRNFDIEKETDVPKYMISLIRAKKCWVPISNNYKLRKRSRSLSCETIHWLCQQIQKGLTQGEILEIATNKRITKNIIQDIRRKRIYKDISKEYGI